MTDVLNPRPASANGATAGEAARTADLAWMFDAPDAPLAAGVAPVQVAAASATAAAPADAADAPPPATRPGAAAAAAGDGTARSAAQEWVCRPGSSAELPDRAVQELWFELRTWGWKSLAVVPVLAGSNDFDIAEQLVLVGVSNTSKPMSLISAEGISIDETDHAVAMIRAAEQRGERVVVVVDPILDNPAAAPIVRAVNGAVLVVRLGRTNRQMLDKTINAVGRNRVIGTVTRPA